MLDQFERMDLTRKPERMGLRPIIWLYTFPYLIKHRCRIKKINMKGVKPPYLLLGNHNSFMDFRVAAKANFPHRANYVSAINGFIGMERLVRRVGTICTRRFSSDTLLVRQLRRVVQRGDIAVMYPEARYALCGTNTVLPQSLGKLIKFLRVPVVTLIAHGTHINSPFWNIGDRKVKPIEAEMECVLTEDQIQEMSVEEIDGIINDRFRYDDFRWQKEKGIRVSLPNRAEGLHSVLYQCPRCMTEYRMESEGTVLRCGACGREWEMTELGELKAKSGETEFSHIPDWYEWERANVRKEIEAGRYGFSSPVRVDFLPNAEGFVDLGGGFLTHDERGLILEGEYEGEHYRVEKPVRSLYSCQIEYNYRGCGKDCVGISTSRDSFYVFPLREDCSVTKISLAVEEMYKLWESKEKLFAGKT